MSGKYHDRFSKAISELEEHNAYVCTSCKDWQKTHNKKGHEHESETHGHKKDMTS